MTIAVCVSCGAIKFGALVPCEACGFSPMQNEEQFTYSMVLSDHYFKIDVLETISKSMLAGHPMPRLSKAQEDAARAQYRLEYERMTKILGPSSDRASDKKRSL